MQRIIVSLDYSDITETVVEQALSIAKAFGSLVYLVHCEPVEGHFALEDDNESFYREIEDISLSIQNEFTSAGVQFVHTQLIKSADIPKSIIKQIEKFNADLLIIGDHRHHKIRRLFGDGIRDQLINKANCPVLLAR